MTFQRARRPEHKRQRYEAILAAARTLAVRDGVRAVSLADIAAAVGMHKSALLRYFETREEIYLRLAADDWRDWVAAMRVALAPLPAGSVAEVAAAFATTLGERPLLCDLLTHAPLNLERNVSLETVREFKRTAVGSVDELSAQVRTVFSLMDKTLHKAGGSLANLVTMTVFINDPRDGDRFVEMRRDTFKDGNYPASALITVSNFARPGMLIEIQGIAVIGDEQK